MERANWKEHPSGILLPDDYTASDGHLGDGQTAGITQSVHPPSKLKFSADGWTAMSAIGQIAAAVVAVVALVVALDTQNKQEESDSQVNARAVSVWPTETATRAPYDPQHPERAQSQQFDVLNESHTLLYSVHLLVGETTDFLTNFSVAGPLDQYDIGEIPACSLIRVTVIPASPYRRSFSVILAFSETDRTWLLNGYVTPKTEKIWSDIQRKSRPGELVQKKVETVSSC